MNIRQFTRAQQKPLSPLRKLIRAVLHALGVPVTPLQVSETALRLYRPTLVAREQTRLATVRYLHDFELPAPDPRDYPLRAMTSTIERVVDDIRIAGEPITEETRTDTRVIEMARVAIEGPITRQAIEPAREMVATIGEDELHAGYGWARVLVGARSCSFCAMLASRGAVYTSRQAALGKGGSPLNLYHTPHLNKNGKTVGGFCDCTAVIVPRGSTSWEGYEAQQRLADLWMDETEDVPYTGALNAFRRTWDKKVRAGQTHIYLPSSLAA